MTSVMRTSCTVLEFAWYAVVDADVSSVRATLVGRGRHRLDLEDHQRVVEPASCVHCPRKVPAWFTLKLNWFVTPGRA